MKKFLILPLLILLFNHAIAQMFYMPDSLLQQRLTSMGYGTCIIGDSIDSSCPQIQSALSLDLSTNSILNFQGIEAFTHLKKLRIDTCIGAPTQLPALPPNLDTLYCDYTNFYSIPALPSTLIYLSASYGCACSTFPALPNNLRYADLDNIFPITSIGVIPDSLRFLDCSYTSLISISALPDSLTDLNLNWVYQFTGLPTLPPQLKHLSASNAHLTTLPALPATIDSMDVSKNPLTSLPALPDSLRYFDCSYCSLPFLSGLPLKIETLKCNNNPISSLGTIPNSLIYLFCYSDSLYALPIIANTSLKNISANHNFIANIPQVPNSLEELDLAYNQLNTLPSMLSNIQYLFVEHNFLTSVLPISNSSIIYFDCSHNSIDSIPALPNLWYLDCSFNNLTSLPASFNTSTYSIVLKCTNNQITALPNSLYKFYEIDCSNNLITYLPPLDQHVFSLNCQNNLIASLPELPPSLYDLNICDNPISCLPALSNLNQFFFTNTFINCIPNYITCNSSNPFIDSVPICDIGNMNNCIFLWNIGGKVYQDIDTSCFHDSVVTPLANIRLKLVDHNGASQQALTSSIGHYTFDVNTYDIFTNSLDTVGIPFTLMCPSSNEYLDTISLSDSLDFFRNYKLKCKDGFDLGCWSILSSQFRPVHTTFVNIRAGDMAQLYQARCASGISGNVKVIIDGQVHFTGNNGGIMPVISGDTLLYSIADFGTINSDSAFQFLLTTDTTAISGDQICITVMVDSINGDYNLNNNIYTHCFTIANSLDPNNKEVYPIGAIDSTQKTLTYTIHFQNTGSAVAENIVIIDTLDSNLNPATFRLLATSHYVYVQILDNNILKVTFPNINLPDSNSMEPMSHGYVQFAIDQMNNLPPGINISNVANIFFDYNQPIRTNTVSNSIVLINNSNFVDNENELIIYPNPTKNIFYLDLAKHYQHATYMIDNLSGIGVKRGQINNHLTPIDLSSFERGIYFVKVIMDSVIVVRKIIKE